MGSAPIIQGKAPTAHLTAAYKRLVPHKGGFAFSSVLIRPEPGDKNNIQGG